MTRRTTIMITAAMIATATVLSGCSTTDSDADQANVTSTAEAASTATSAASSTTETTSVPKFNPAPPIGPAQTVTTSDGVSRVSVSPPALYTDAEDGRRALVVPVVIDVDSGTLKASSNVWRVRTGSGLLLEGSTTNSLPRAIGTGELTGHLEGDIYIPGYSLVGSSNKLADDVTITDIELITPSAGDSTPALATWTLPEPLAVKDLPRHQ